MAEGMAVGTEGEATAEEVMAVEAMAVSNTLSSYIRSAKFDNNVFQAEETTVVVVTVEADMVEEAMEWILR